MLRQLPALYSQENNPDPLVVCKFFTPDAGWTWYAIEGSPVDADGFYDTDKPKVDFLFFGLVSGLDVELGYFSLSELQRIRGKFVLHVVRDRFFAKLDGLVGMTGRGLLIPRDSAILRTPAV